MLPRNLNKYIKERGGAVRANWAFCAVGVRGRGEGGEVKEGEHGVCIGE